MNKRPLLAASLVLTVLSVLGGRSAFAADAPAATTGEGWEVGARTNYFTVDPFLPYFYDKTKPVNGATFAGFASKHSPGGNRLELGLAYSKTSPKDGLWLEAGEDVTAQEWTEFRNVSIIDLSVMIGREWSFGPFGFFAGAGIGVAVPQGTITSFDAPAGVKTPGTADKKKIPPAAPTVLVRLGPTVKVGPKITLHADMGLHNGFYGGVGLGWNLF